MTSWTRGHKRIAALLLPVLAWDGILHVLRLVQGFHAIARDPASMGSLDWMGLLTSPLLYHCGLSLVCAGLVFATERSTMHWAGLAAAQVLALFTLVHETAAYAYFVHTTSPLDYGHVRYWVTRPRDLAIVAGVLSPSNVLPLGLVFLVVVALPWILGRRTAPATTVTFSRSLTFAIAGAGIACIGLFPPADHARSVSMARDPVLELAASAVAAAPETKAVQLVRTLDIAGTALPYNVVVVLLESTRARSVPPWGSGAPMPFLAELAKESLIVERAYTVMPHTAKALVAVLCGLEPAHTIEPMALKMGLVDRCLPQLLREQGYSTVYFQSANPFFEDRRRVIREMSFEQMFAPDVFDLKRFQKANFVGYEDEVMLPSSQRWLEDHKSRRFFATYLTSAPHHECWPLRRHGTLQLSANPALDGYLNNVRSEDFFLQGLVGQYRELGLLDSTVFVILGDHGEAFGEHGRSAHDVVPYEETMRIPMMIWDPGQRLVKPGSIKGPVSQLDLMPTLLDLLGFEVVKGRLPGKNILKRAPLDPVYGSCSATRECATRVTGWQKVIHWYGKRPDEYFDLRADPNEQHDLAATKQTAIAEAVDDLRHWDARVAAIYWGEGLLAQKHP